MDTLLPVLLIVPSQWPFEFGITASVLQVRKLRPRGAQILDSLWLASARAGIIKKVFLRGGGGRRRFLDYKPCALSVVLKAGVNRE